MGNKTGLLVDISDLVTVTDIGKKYGVDRKTIYNWLARGVAPENVTICGVHYFFRSALRDFKPPARGRKPNGGR
jgi:hypothetical protein